MRVSIATHVWLKEKEEEKGERKLRSQTAHKERNKLSEITEKK